MNCVCGTPSSDGGKLMVEAGSTKFYFACSICMVFALFNVFSGIKCQVSSSSFHVTVSRVGLASQTS